MVITEALPNPRPAAAQSVDVDHLYCCDSNVAMCGADLSQVPFGREFPDMCPLCLVADEQGYCPRREQ